ncbi:ribonucleoside-diphosphate reductase beta chain [Tahibacter aquaticus]|uniref:Ribonucleoside-diphosphate reductase subunit beta n=1 Tax=Tahibacter aquaticus TaxID=520092 RepID=A0A4R6Z7D1_9GAMM|nr:ribonucleotide-diphosphate reductase subunit beta [Tahibacter aquaticus]TDR47489.1 ribonucleoside-diphosphate reductase beta chain [Tahibacter aquaticus]
MSAPKILDPGLELTLRPMRYPIFFDFYKKSIRNTWTVEEVDFSDDRRDLRTQLSPGELHLVERLVAFFATGDMIVSNNVVLNLYRHINSPEARLYLSRQIFEEAQHVEFYLTLLDTYLDDPERRSAAFRAIDDVASIRRKGEFCLKWMGSVDALGPLHGRRERQAFLLNLICFAACIEGLFFFGAFAYVYYLRSRGLLNGLATGTNWVFRDESMHIAFAFKVIDQIRTEEPELFDAALQAQVEAMIDEALACEIGFAQDVIGDGIAGLPLADMIEYLRCIADERLVALGMPRRFGARNPLSFLVLQDAQELTNFFERRVSSYQVGIGGNIRFDQAF